MIVLLGVDAAMVDARRPDTVTIAGLLARGIVTETGRFGVP
jgi:hypothetical protein